MAKEDIAPHVIFSGDESDALFISAIPHAPIAPEIINNFTYMLGDTGEEFIVETAAHDSGDVEVEIPAITEDAFFDVDHIIAAADASDAEQPGPVEIEHLMPEFTESQVDLDLIFDHMQISAPADTDDIETIPRFLSDNPLSDMAAYDMSILPISGLDAYDPGADIDTLFKSLFVSDES